MKALIKRPDADPERIEIENNLETLQTLVGGYIEPLTLVDGLVMIVNEEGKLHGLDENFLMQNDMILGPALFVGQDGEEFADIRENDAVVLETFFSIEPQLRELVKKC